MASRNLSPQQMFEKLALEHHPELQFDGGDFEAWKKCTLPRVLNTLKEFPARVPLNPELLHEWPEGSLRNQRWVIDVGPHISATLRVSWPADLPAGEKRPALLCWHGHGTHGKESVMGNPSPPVQAEIANHNYDYGKQMAEAGFVTFAIDWMGIGERSDRQKPNFRREDFGRDWCNLYYLHATMLGMTSISINVTHGMAATDFVSTLPQVDSNRLGVMGLSGGGTMTVWSTLCDERLKASEIICYSDLWATLGIRDVNYCGMQVAPGLYKLVDIPDLQGLIAPRPLLVDIGTYDSGFIVDDAMACHRQLEKIYAAAGASDRLELDNFSGEHAWGGNRSVDFFTKYLG